MIKGYLDNASTTETKFFAKDFYIPGNPNSPHGLGLKAHEALEEARARVKDCLGVKGGKVIMGQNATQLERKIERVFTWLFASQYEHDLFQWNWFCDIKDMKDLENRLAKYSYDSEEFPVAVAWMLTNNITGSIYDVKSIGELCHKYGAYYIMDCTASIGHNSLDADVEDYCDCILTSAHKYHGEIGNGCMWVSDRLARLLDLEEDSHDEYGLIPGTPNVSGAVAMSYAMKHVMDWNNSQQIHDGKFNRHFLELYMALREGLSQNLIEHNIVDSSEDWYTCAISAITLPGFNADALVQFLSSRGVYISAGHSACSSDNPDASRVLEAFGLTKEEASQTVRISFCEDSSFEEVDMLVNGIVEFCNKFM